MIHVAGGAYGEHCVEPHWDELFGSGVRAAVALSGLSGRVSLTTYIGDADRLTLQSIAANYGFDVAAEDIPSTVEFYYHHGLSAPIIHPDPLLINRAAGQRIEAPNILRFGFLEGDAVVHAKQAVYDPQNGREPALFRANGSAAERLAVVANEWECAKLAGGVPGSNPKQLGETVLEAEGAEVVVVKRGSVGALVVTAGETREVPAYRTAKVWPVGSGDVFSAVFAHYWCVEGLDPFESARLASLSTAFYCQTKSLEIPKNIALGFTPPPVTLGPRHRSGSHKQVYLAGPFFTMSQRWLIEESLMSLSSHGLSVFSPLHDVGYGSAAEVVPADIKGIESSDVVFAILDGLDTGTVFEIGYARALGKPVVAFVQNEAEVNLKMLVGTGCELVDDFASAIYRTAWAAIAL